VDHTACIGHDVESSHHHAARHSSLPEPNTLHTQSGLFETCTVWIVTAVAPKQSYALNTASLWRLPRASFCLQAGYCMLFGVPG